MTRLPVVNARQLVAALLRAGFFEDHQKGSHLVLFHPIKRKTTVVPVHPGDLPRGLVRAILKQAEILEEEFRNLL